MGPKVLAMFHIKVDYMQHSIHIQIMIMGPLAITKCKVFAKLTYNFTKGPAGDVQKRKSLQTRATIVSTMQLAICHQKCDSGVGSRLLSTMLWDT